MTPHEGGPAGPVRSAGEALDRALRFIEYRPRSRGETTERLRRWGYSAETSLQVVDHLNDCGMLDDRSFARVYLGEMVRKGLGYYRVRGELLKKKLERALVDDVMEEYPIEDELERALGVAAAFVRKRNPVEMSTIRQKLMDYLIRRGYSRKVAIEACRLTCDVDT